MPTKPVKVYLHHRYGDVETLPCEPCGKLGKRRLFRLLAIPFFFTKPTFGDVIAAARDAELDGHWAWEPSHPLTTRDRDLHEDGGRYAMIFDYRPSGKRARPRPVTGETSWFPRELDIVSSRAIEPTRRTPGRVYLAVPSKLPPARVMALVRKRHPEFSFRQVHPRPKTAVRR